MTNAWPRIFIVLRATMSRTYPNIIFFLKMKKTKYKNLSKLAHKNIERLSQIFFLDLFVHVLDIYCVVGAEIHVKLTLNSANRIW